MDSKIKQKEIACSESMTEQEQVIDLSVVIPAYNEQQRLPATLAEIIDVLAAKKISYEIIVVDDGSSDETCDVTNHFEQAHQQIKLIQLEKNYGKGQAVKKGVLQARGKQVMFCDADGAVSFKEVDRLLAAFLESGAEVIIGSRAKGSERTLVQANQLRKFLGRVYNRFVNILILSHIDDTQCGFKLFSAPAARFLFSKQRLTGYSFDVEILYLARQAGLKIEEVPVNWNEVPGSKVNLVIDSLKMLRDIFYLRFLHKEVNPQRYRMFIELGS